MIVFVPRKLEILTLTGILFFIAACGDRQETKVAAAFTTAPSTHPEPGSNDIVSPSSVCEARIGATGEKLTPSAPVNLKGLPQNGQVALFWEVPSQGVACDYLVQFRPSNTSVWTTFANVSSIKNKATVTGLRPAGSYFFRVAAIAPDNVRGPFTAEINSTVPESNLESYLDQVSPSGVVQGWAVDLNNPSSSLEIEITINAASVGLTSTNQSRPDVAAWLLRQNKIKVHENTGFKFQLPQKYLDGQAYSLAVYATTADKSTKLLVSYDNPRAIRVFDRKFITQQAYLRALSRLPSPDEEEFWSSRANSRLDLLHDISSMSSWLNSIKRGKTSLNLILKQPSVETTSFNIATDSMNFLKEWAAGSLKASRLPMGFFFPPDYPGRPAPDRSFWLSINNPAKYFNPPTRSKEKFFEADISSLTGFKPKNPLKSQWTFDVDNLSYPQNAVQVEGDTIGMRSSTKSFLPVCASANGSCTNKGQFVMAMNYNFDVSTPPRFWSENGAVLMTFDLQVPHAISSNKVKDNIWNSAAFFNSNLLLVDTKSKKQFWYSVSIFDARGYMNEFYMIDECGNGLCLGYPIIFSSIAPNALVSQRHQFSYTLPDSHYSPQGTWRGQYRTFSYVIDSRHMEAALKEIYKRQGGISLNPSDIGVYHMNLSPELSRGHLDDAEIGVSFKNFRMYQIKQ